MKLAACIGNGFDVNTLSVIHKKDAAETKKDLF
jgi:predicted ATPase